MEYSFKLTGNVLEVFYNSVQDKQINVIVDELIVISWDESFRKIWLP
jgi:hypothetical protein